MALSSLFSLWLQRAGSKARGFDSRFTFPPNWGRGSDEGAGHMQVSILSSRMFDPVAFYANSTSSLRNSLRFYYVAAQRQNI